MSENVRVIVRSRPMNKNEKDQKKIVQIANLCVKLENGSDPTVPPKSFTFDSVFDDTAPTEVIYNDICYPLVESVLEGFNATIFAYGQTGCGKSFTMSSSSNQSQGVLKSSQRGIIPRAFEHIFDAINVSQDSRFLAFVSYLEIYNENIRDLLVTGGNLPLKETSDGGIVVQNLSQHPVLNVEDCEKLLDVGNNNRAVGGTNMNATSSRSHSIFSICVEQVAKEGVDDDDDLDLMKLGPTVKRGKLNLVDLAGSERQGKTGATGDRLKEATKINLSLSALGNVISALVDGKTKHIPYRDSKLTRLLQDSLGGNTKTLMIACISPAASNYDETLSTLRYANRAKNISNKPTLNEDPTETIIRQYREEIMRLKEMLTTQSSGGVGTPEVNRGDMESERERLRLDMLRVAEDQRREKENLMREMEDLKVYYENKLNRSGGGEEDVAIIEKAAALKEELTVLEEKEGEVPRVPEIVPDSPKMNKEEIYQRIKEMKGTLIGGERRNDVKLKEKREKKKIAAEYKQRILKDALNRIAVDEEREQLQGHYSDIQQELEIKTEALKARRQRIRVLEREIEDLHSEFQLERADYLESIRKLEQGSRFYQQLTERALPIIRRDNRFWDVDDIRSRSEWSDDAKKWTIPEDVLRRVTLPPAAADNNNCGESYTAPGRMQHSSLSVPPSPNVDEESREEERSDFLIRKLQSGDNQLIVDSYFRPKRARELLLRHANSSLATNNNRGRNMLNKMLTETNLYPPTTKLKNF